MILKIRESKSVRDVARYRNGVSQMSPDLSGWTWFGIQDLISPQEHKPASIRDIRNAKKLVKFLSQAISGYALTGHVVPASLVHLAGEQLEADDGVYDDDEEN